LSGFAVNDKPGYTLPISAIEFAGGRFAELVGEVEEDDVIDKPGYKLDICPVELALGRFAELTGEDEEDDEEENEEVDVSPDKLSSSSSNF
jgi:hypothetical protein